MAATRSLYEDWRQRRERLLTGGAPQGRGYVDAQVQVLDFMLQRYGSSEVAQKPARFPLNSEMAWNKRALVVHHHLAQSREAGRKKDVSSILRRISGQGMQEDVATPGGGALLGRVESGPLLPWQAQIDLTLDPFNISISRREWLFNRIADSLTVNPLLTEDDMHFLYQNIQDARAVEFLSRSTNADAADIIMSGLRDGLPTEHFRKFFDAPAKRARAADRFRAELATPNGEVRLRVIEVLAQIGDLDDICLMMDLLALPVSEDEMAGEREALVAAMKKISGSEAA